MDGEDVLWLVFAVVGVVAVLWLIAGEWLMYRLGGVVITGMVIGIFVGWLFGKGYLRLNKK
jgi:hypothetical protein